MNNNTNKKLLKVKYKVKKLINKILMTIQFNKIYKNNKICSNLHNKVKFHNTIKDMKG